MKVEGGGGWGERVAPFAFVVLWSSSFVASRAGLALISPLLFVGVRLLIAAALLGLVALARGEDWAALRGRWHHLALAGALTNGAAVGAFHVGLVTVDGAVMALVQTLNPLLIAVLAVPLLGERLRARQWFGLGLGVAGTLLVVAPRAAGSRAEMDAILFGLAGVVALAAGTISFGRHGRGTPLLPGTAVQLAAGAALALLLMLLFERPRAEWNGTAVAAVAWNVVAVSIGGMALYYFLLSRGAAGRVAANFCLVPGTAALLGWALLGEALTPLGVAGFLAASVGVFLVARR